MQKSTPSSNGIVIEQRVIDGFINGTAMCKAHGKRIKAWFSNQDTIEFLIALAQDMGVEPKGQNSALSSVATVSAAFPFFVVVKTGSPENGGGTWVHPDLAIKLAYWCNKPLEIQVIRWVKEWVVILNNQAEQERKERQAELKRPCATAITSADDSGILLTGLLRKPAMISALFTLSLASSTWLYRLAASGFSSACLRSPAARLVPHGLSLLWIIYTASLLELCLMLLGFFTVSSNIAWMCGWSLHNRHKSSYLALSPSGG